MQKDFDNWSKKKKVIQDRDRAFFREGDVWWSSLGVNIGSEEDGKNNEFERPIMILKKFNKEIFWALPITTQQKSGRYYFTYTRDGNQYAILLSQIRLLDSKRLKRKIFSFSTREQSEICESFKALLPFL